MFIRVISAAFRIATRLLRNSNELKVKESLNLIYALSACCWTSCWRVSMYLTCVCDACAEPHSECVWLGVRPSLLYAGAHRRGIMGRETNSLRSETRDKRNPASSERDGPRVMGMGRDRGGQTPAGAQTGQLKSSQV